MLRKRITNENKKHGICLLTLSNVFKVLVRARFSTEPEVSDMVYHAIRNVYLSIYIFSKRKRKIVSTISAKKKKKKEKGFVLFVRGVFYLF